MHGTSIYTYIHLSHSDVGDVSSQNNIKLKRLNRYKLKRLHCQTNKTTSKVKRINYK